MPTQYVCFHNNYGYCKFKEECRRRHVNTICENKSCEVSTCNSRHPKWCKYPIQYGRCKFNPCAFLYFERDDSIDNLTKENELISENIRKLDKEIEKLNDKLASSNNLDEKLSAVEVKMDQFNSMREEISEKYSAF